MTVGTGPLNGRACCMDTLVIVSSDNTMSPGASCSKPFTIFNISATE